MEPKDQKKDIVSDEPSLMLSNTDCFYLDDHGVGEALQRIGDMLSTLGSHFSDGNKERDMVQSWGAVMTLHYFKDQVPRILESCHKKSIESFPFGPFSFKELTWKPHLKVASK